MNIGVIVAWSEKDGNNGGKEGLRDLDLHLWKDAPAIYNHIDELEDILLSETDQTRKDKYCMRSVTRAT